MITVQHSAKDDRIYFKQARSLAKAGFNVHIVSVSAEGIPKDMAKHDVPSEDELGISFPCLKESKSPIQRYLKKIYLGKFYSGMVSKATSTGAQIFVAHEPQSIMIARKAAKATQGTWVYDAHESLLFTSTKDRWALKTEMNKLPAFTAANSITAAALTELNPKAKSAVIYNASVLQANPDPKSEELLIIHEGSLPFNRGLNLMMKALAILKMDGIPFAFKIIGSLGRDEQEFFNLMVEENDLQKEIELVGWVPYEDLGSHLKGGAIGLILNTPSPNNLYGGPANKLFNYMSQAMMVIAVDLPDTTRILAEEGFGITLSNRSPKTLADALKKALDDELSRMTYRKAALESFKKNSWEQESKKLIAFYEELVKS